MPTALDLDALPYRRGACVGSGGGGEVFAAWDGDDRQVALKVAFGADDLTAARFAREIANAGLLPARYVPRVFAHGRLADGRPWLAMEWLGGGTLGQRLDAAPWSVAATAALGAAVARALAAAHAVGVVHRDVKPDNIMFRADGEVVLVDLGLARADDDPASSATRCAGTPVAMAPEQVLGEAITPATDLYALGVLLYRLRAGRDPFTGSALEIQLAHLGQVAAPLPASAEPGAAALAALIGELLRKRPGDRPASATAVAARLAALTPRRWPGRLARLAVAIAALATLSIAPPAGAALAPPAVSTAAPAPAVPRPDQPWVMTDAGDYTLRASWSGATRAGGTLRVTVELWDADGRPLGLGATAGALRDPHGRVTALAGAALGSLALPVRAAGDYVLTVFAPEGDLTMAVTIPVGQRPNS